jgi:branched-chain amino acid transport system substrate-binding protein
MAAVKTTAAVLVVLLAGLAAACAGGDDGAEPVASRQCAPLLYEGAGEPDVIVVSDLPRRGIGAETTELMVGAIEFVLRKREFRAGELRVGYQSCNDTVGDEPFDPSLCRRNAQTYVDTEDVVGIVGPWNSACAVEQIPIVSRRAAGPLAMISPSNTFEGLTQPPGAEPLYPDDVRSYARVVALNGAQGAASAQVAKGLGARRAVVLHEDLRDDLVRTLVEQFDATARGVGLETVRVPWPVMKDYSELAESVASAQPDVVYLAGLTQGNAKRLVEDLRAALPPDVELLAPDGFAYSFVAQELGAAGEGMLVTATSIPSDLLPPAGQQFVREFGHDIGEPGFLGAPEAAQATEVLLDAIAASDGTRASVVDELFATKVENGILGSFSFDAYGDIDPAPIGVYRFENGKIVAHDVVRAPVGSGP